MDGATEAWLILYKKLNRMYRIYVYIYERIFVFEKTDFENSLAVCKGRPITD